VADPPGPEMSGDAVIGRYVHESVPRWPTPARPPPGAPNIVYIVLDDVGYADVGCYGGEIATPHLDGLARRGLRFTNFHTTALCSPTRAALLTGRNHHSVGMGVVSNWDTGFPGYRCRMAQSAGTLAEMLHPHGYNSYAVGKWHLVPHDEMTAAGPFGHWPLQRGFDRFYGFLDGSTDHWVPDLVEDNHWIDPPSRPGYHLSEDLAEHATTWVRDHRSVLPGTPFFLYLCFGTAHYPLQVPASYIARYRGRYDAGWDAIREERFARQKQLGIIPAEAELAPRNPGVRPWDDLTPAERRVAARFMEVYAAFITHADEQIGSVLAELERSGVAADTLFALLSDNGASGEGAALGSLNYMAHANGLPPEAAEELDERIDEIGGPATSPMYPAGWAMASNTPLKRYKTTTHGGGIRDPLILSWPARLGDQGSVRDQYHHVTDVTPTVLELIGIVPPEEIKGVPQQALEGVSMCRVLADRSAAGAKRVQYYEMLGSRAIWRDGWKAVAFHPIGSDFEDDRWELYHTDTDFSECHDLAAEHPGKLTELVELWWSEASRHQALPLDDRIMERFQVPIPPPLGSPRRFTYFPGSYIPSHAAPNIKDVTYSLCVWLDCADLDVAAGEADGVLVSCGDRFCGYTLFVKDGRLVHDYNCAGTHHVARSEGHILRGAGTVRYQFIRTGMFSGNGAVLIGDEVAGTVVLPRTLAMNLSIVGLTVGRSRLSAVSPEYESPFAFPGTIDRVVFELVDDRPVDDGGDGIVLD